jgi:hypothetical protein
MSRSVSPRKSTGTFAGGAVLSAGVERRTGPRLAFGLLVVTAVAICPHLLRVRVDADDGLVGAQSILVAQGAVPYRDYFSPLMPGSDLLYGMLFKVTGPTYLGFRLLTMGGLVTGVGLLLALADKLIPKVWAAGVALLWGGWMGPFVDRGPYHILGPVAVLAMAWCLVRGHRSSRWERWLFSAGVFGSAAVLLIQSMAPAAVSGVVAAAATQRDRVRAVFVTAAGSLAVAVPVWIWLWASGGLGQFFHQVFGFSIRSYLPANFVGMPFLPHDLRGLWSEHLATLSLMRTGIWALAFVGPPFAGILLGLEAVARREACIRRELLVLILVTMGLWVGTLYRPAAGVLWPSAAPALVLLATIGWTHVARVHSLRPLGGAVAALLVVGGLLPPSLRWLTDLGVLGSRQPVWISEERVLAAPGSAHAMRRIIALARTHQGEDIAFLPSLKAMYVITQRPPPISFVILKRGYNTPAQVQQAEQELVHREVDWVVFAPRGIDFGRVSTPEPWRFEAFLETRYGRAGMLRAPQRGPILLLRLQENEVLLGSDLVARDGSK